MLCFFLGFVIYFGYGIWHSTEAALASNDTEYINIFKPTMTNEPATPEKEAFLSNGINVRAEESSDPWENTWNTLLRMALCAHYTDVCDLQQLKRPNWELLLMFKTMSFVLL